jgi:hypothetical protein
MILCNRKKIGIFFPNKTGSSYIYEIFRKNKLFLSLDDLTHDHINYPTLVSRYRFQNFEDYRFYCFYRNPIERFISGYMYMKRTEYTHFLHYFYGKQYSSMPATHYLKVPYISLSEKLKEKIEKISFSDFLENCKLLYNKAYIRIGYGVFYKQINWLNHPNINLLDYRNFQEESNTLFSMFRLTKPELPKINESIRFKTDPNIENLSSEEISQIKDIYKDDYDFFASRGISF